MNVLYSTETNIDNVKSILGNSNWCFPWINFFLKPRSNVKERISLYLIEIMVVHYCHSKLETEFDIKLEIDFEVASEFKFETEFKLEFKFEFKIEFETWA